jgi:hypothetical protein
VAALALHPLQVESVAGGERKNLLSTSRAARTGAYASYARRGDCAGPWLRRWREPAGEGHAVTLPFVLLLLDVRRRATPHGDAQTLAAREAPLLLLAAAVGASTRPGGRGAVALPRRPSWLGAPRLRAHAYLHHLGRVLAHQLAVLYPHPLPQRGASLRRM